MVISLILAGILFLYGSSIAAIYIFQKIIIFQPRRLRKDHEFVFENQFSEHFIPTFDHQSLNALHFKSPEPPKGLVVYFHGNADNLKRWGLYSLDFTRKQFDVLMIDYKGFGKSTGTPTEQGLFDDAECTLKWARANLGTNYEKLIFYGRSLGAAMATKLATKHTPHLLILETPFDSIRGAFSKALFPLVFPFAFKFKLENIRLLPEVKCKVVVITGTRDRITPLSSARRLIPVLKENDQFIIIPKGRHRNLRKFGLFHLKLAEALNDQLHPLKKLPKEI